MKSRSRTSSAMTLLMILFLVLSQRLAAQERPSSPPASLDVVREYRKNHEAEILRELVEFLAIPNVASDSANIRKNAERLIEMMKRRDIRARLLEGDGPPSVFGELITPGAVRTIGLYAHYDGQPVDASKWATPPWQPALRSAAIDAGGELITIPRAGEKVEPEWRLYARSASDDKAPIIAMLAALDALKAFGIKPVVNLKFFFEGEEEAGSRHLEKLLLRHKDLLSADVWICADGPVHQSRRAAVFFGCRGIVSANITVYGPLKPLHSGHYGNWAPNPAMMLARLLASMKADNGRVLIDGFYDGAEPLGEEEKQAIAESASYDRTLMKELGIVTPEGGGRSLAELINEPSLNIDGLRSEYVGGEARTIIPAEATAAVDLRLVKGIDPDRQLERLIAHIKKQGYFVTTDEPTREMRLKHARIARVTSSEGYRAARTPMNLPIAKKIVSAVERAMGERPVLMPTLGGSGPLSIFDSVTGIPQIGVPIVNHDNNQHATNENLRLQNLWDGIQVFAALMTMK
ncbi:MAG TPA: M20/M25/M40 family metallo-hydrolase [Blastocatellia bacterium]|nr:M20/M25/M40 family metallo-hydrolase [Blastocatellia bacterium]